MALAALATLTACQQPEEPTAMVNDGTIKFMSAETRATTVTTDIGDEFKVLGYVGDNELFNEAAIKPAGESYWATTTTKYWVDNTAYTFFGVYPSKDITRVDETQAKVSYTNTGDEDLVIAGLSMTSGVAKTQAAADLKFKHALSRLRFSFTNKFTDAQLKVRVANVKLNARSGESATATITAGATTAGVNASTIVWTTPEATENAIDFAFDATDGTSGNGNDIANSAVEITDYQYIIPNATAQYTMAADVTVYTTDGDIHTYQITNANVVTTGDSFNFEVGKSYTFNMNVVDNLKKITFTVSVEDWGTGTGGDINFDTTK